jgi:hypothetical protein
VQAQGLAHSDGESCHHPHEPWAIVAANKVEKYSECLQQNQIKVVEEIGFGKGKLQADAILQIQVGFRQAKVDHDLNVGDILILFKVQVPVAK